MAYTITGEVLDASIVADLLSGMILLKNQLYDESTHKLLSDEQIRKMSPTINEWLITSGKHMATVGNSRPASGTEHMMSHVMEMERLRLKLPSVYHGIKVGISTLLVLDLYSLLMNHLDEVRAAYQLTNHQIQSIEAIYKQGIYYRPFVEAYQEHIAKEHDVTRDELLDGVIRSIKVRDRFVVATVLDRLSLLETNSIETLISKVIL